MVIKAYHINAWMYMLHYCTIYIRPNDTLHYPSINPSSTSLGLSWPIFSVINELEIMGFQGENHVDQKLSSQPPSPWPQHTAISILRCV